MIYKVQPPVIEKKTRRLQVLMQPSLYKRVARAARECDVSVNEFINQVLDQATSEGVVYIDDARAFEVGARLYQTSRRR